MGKHRFRWCKITENAVWSNPNQRAMLRTMKRMRRGPGTLTFIRTELETGFTFATIAAQARDEEKIDRNRANARKACWSARHFMDRMPLSASESDELHQKLEELEGRLRLLEKVA